MSVVLFLGVEITFLTFCLAVVAVAEVVVLLLLLLLLLLWLIAEPVARSIDIALKCCSCGPHRKARAVNTRLLACMVCMDMNSGVGFVSCLLRQRRR